LCSFFRSIGSRKSGEKVAMDWSKVVGGTGRATLSIREYKKDGEDRRINQVKKWLDPKPSAEPAGFTEGAF
jgi:hypothetical protein